MLPFGKQFSPEQITLKVLANLIVDHAGDRAALESAIAQAFHQGKGDPATLAMNTFLAARSYGLLEGDQQYVATALTTTLATLGDAEGKERFAAHILTNLQGLTVVEVVRARVARTEPLAVQAIADDLNNLGVDPGGERGEKLSAVRQWLQAGGVLSSGWTIDPAGLERALGPSIDDLDVLLAMPLEHRAFLRALGTMTGTAPPYNSQAVAATADLQSGTRLRALRDLPTRVLLRLEHAGWISSVKATSGRGAKAFLLAPTQKFKDEISGPLADAMVEQAALGDPASLRRPLVDLLAEVRDLSLPDQSRGQSLEGVAIHLVRLLGARFRGWRRRAPETSYAEVDVIGDLVDGRHQILQLQSKVSSISTRDIIDREMGVAGRLRSNIIIFVSAGKVGGGPRRAADEHMADTNLSLLFLDGRDLDDLAAGATSISEILRREFAHVAEVKAQRLPRP
jgi:hypothetical protein